jgi:adenylosuccinate synthase
MLKNPSKTPDQQVILVVDLGFGDSGKGSMIDFLTRFHHAHTVIRFNGGAQAAHNVVTLDGRHHTFSQFGSGTFIPGVKTYLSRYMLVEPYAMCNEEAHLHNLGVTDAFSRTFLDRNALIISPFQQAANRLKEMARGTSRHGSCGMGIGETMSDFIEHKTEVLFAGDMPDQSCVKKKLRFLRDIKWTEIEPLLPALQSLNAAQDILSIFNEPEVIDIAAENYTYLSGQINLVDETFADMLFKQPGTAIFEGAQGVLLDETYGFAPYTTWSNTTFDNALTLLSEQQYAGKIQKLGLLRTYYTRHGAGPFVSEDPTLANVLAEPHNSNSPWQQHFRVGYFDLIAARYALEVVGTVDGLVITHVDKLAHMSDWKLCEAYQYAGDENNLADFFEHQGQTISKIAVKRPPTLAHQEQLARHLFRCKPQYQTVTGMPDDFLLQLETLLGVQITLTSGGITAQDKQFRRAI